uniref:AAA+ ATPase domain-containing protein n=1 Tax=Biomphalaria glabrata TaxID=6526 RepID=A0A2C9JR48_BIOGL
MDMGFDSKSKAKISTSNLTFNDVAGYKEEKEELQEIVSFLTSPEKFNAMGVRLPRGVLLVGPAGTGKTLLAKAVAGEANVPFFSVSGSDFVEMFVGLGASRVRDLFKTARKMSPCIIFFDEIDAVGRSRGIGIGGGNDEREQTLNQILVELDGFNTSSGIVVMAATNRAEVLDPALLRPGRFDRKVNFHLPNLQERMQILKIHAKNKNFDVTVDFELIGRKTAGFSGAELENLINEAAILAVRFGKTIVTNDEINESFDRIIAGLSKVSKVYTKHEKELIAYHEAGHALIGLKMETGDKVTKVSIVPRGNAGGYTLSTPEEDNSLMPKKQLVSKIITFLGGRASEELIFGKDNITTGAVNDFEVSSDIIRRMVTVFGMSELGMVNYAIVTSNNSSGYAIPREVTISDKKLNQIDEIVEKTMIECYDQSKKILKKYRKELDLIAQGLLKYETLDEEDLKQILETHTIPEKNVEDLAHNKLRKPLKITGFGVLPYYVNEQVSPFFNNGAMAYIVTNPFTFQNIAKTYQVNSKSIDFRFNTDFHTVDQVNAKQALEQKISNYTPIAVSTFLAQQDSLKVGSTMELGVFKSGAINGFGNYQSYSEYHDTAINIPVTKGNSEQSFDQQVDTTDPYLSPVGGPFSPFNGEKGVDNRYSVFDENDDYQTSYAPNYTSSPLNLSLFSYLVFFDPLNSPGSSTDAFLNAESTFDPSQARPTQDKVVDVNNSVDALVAKGKFKIETIPYTVKMHSIGVANDFGDARIFTTHSLANEIAGYYAPTTNDHFIYNLQAKSPFDLTSSTISELSKPTYYNSNSPIAQALTPVSLDDIENYLSKTPNAHLASDGHPYQDKI